MIVALRRSSASTEVQDVLGAAGAARRLYDCACALVAALPIVMVLANRSSPLILGLAALAAVAGAAREGRLVEIRRRAGAWLAAPLGAAALAMLAWSALSIVWSPMRGVSAQMLGEFALPVVAAILLALLLPGRVDARRWSAIAAAGAIVAGLLVVADLQSGMILRQELGKRVAVYVLNRPALTLLVLLPGLALLLWRNRRPWWIAALAVVTALALGCAFSGAAKLGLIAGLLVFALALVARRAALAVVTTSLMLSIAVAPVLGDLAERLLPSSVVQRLESGHAQDRIDIWRSFGAAVRVDPWVGAGFGTSGRFGGAPVAGRLAPEFRPLLDVGHPHNAPLQIWAELGVVGAALAALVATLTVRLLSGLSGFGLAAALATVAACLAVWLVGQGAWQGWWPAGIGASILWFRLALAQDD